MTKNFNEFGLQPEILDSISNLQFTTPTPIQSQAIPHALEGKDILATAQTGSGKTCAFGIPLISFLLENESKSALIMTPTRELASQVADMLKNLINKKSNINLALLIGGDPIGKQFKQLRTKIPPRLIVGTPGRINDHIKRSTLKLDTTSFIVLDETDRMLDMGFGIQIDEILKRMPIKKQTLLFSATLPKKISILAEKYLSNPTRITVDSTNTPVSRIKQETLDTVETEKPEHLINQIESREGSIIVFVKTKISAEKMAKKLQAMDHSAVAIHGDLRQSQRDRVIKSFRNEESRIMIATDIAARGLDIPHVRHVINYDIPYCPEDYIHRIGRTARAGAEGEAVNLVTPQDGKKWGAIQRMLNPDLKIERSSRKKRIGNDKPFKSGKKKFKQNKKSVKFR